MGVDGEPLEPNDLRIFAERERLSDAMFSIGGGTVAVFSAKSPERDGPNEDAAGILVTGPGRAVLAVADGIGGARAGNRASAVAIECVLGAVGRALRDGQDVRHGILNGFDAANEAVLSLGGGAGTTLTAVDVNECAIRAFHVGDSSMLVTGQRGKIRLQTIPHSPVGYGVESGLLDEADAMHHEERHLVSNTIGAADMRIDVGSPYDLAPRDTMVLSSDGLSDNLHTSEIADCVRRGSLAAAAAKLAAMANERMNGADPEAPSKPDDLTFLIFRLT